MRQKVYSSFMGSPSHHQYLPKLFERIWNGEMSLFQKDFIPTNAKEIFSYSIKILLSV